MLISFGPTGKVVKGTILTVATGTPNIIERVEAPEVEPRKNLAWLPKYRSKKSDLKSLKA